MNEPRRVRGWRGWLSLMLIPLVAILGFFAWQHWFPVVAASGWTSKVYLDDVAMVAALQTIDDGGVYVTQEFGGADGVLFRQLPDGTRRSVIGGLNKPDGLARFRGGILVSQEGADKPLLWVHGGRAEELFRGTNIEGMDADADRIYAVEDQKATGRLLQFEPDSGRMTVLRTGLHEAEGVAVCPDGRLFYSEKAHGWVMQYRPGQEDLLVQGGLKQPGFLTCTAEGLWIAEDATHGARVLLVDAGGVLHVVLSRLRSAQAVLAIGQGRYLVAEQGRQRILEFHRTRNGT